MDENTKKLFDYLKESGKVSGGTIKEALGFSNKEYKKAKNQLNAAGILILGRGRGGTVELLEGAEPPLEPVKLTKAEIMEGARQEKAALSKQQKFHKEIHEYARNVADKQFPDLRTEIHIVDVDYNGHWARFHVWVWENKKAKIYGGYYE